MEAALASMQALESGARANATEDRQVGHYWLRTPELAPDAATRLAITEAWTHVESLVARTQGTFSRVLWIGMGGSALGPQLLYRALPSGPNAPEITFVDNCDPHSISRWAAPETLSETLFVVVSKSGRTAETLRALDALEGACHGAGVELASRLLAITEPGSELDQRADDQGWLGRLPVWSWVGGRTSIFSPVGLLMLGLMGRDMHAFLGGGRAMDAWTRTGGLHENPALTLAACLCDAVETGWENLAILPYRDRLELFGRYLQQLVMESLGKTTQRDGDDQEMGLTVFGTKGTSDQHAFVQQLRDGADDALVGFVEVLDDEIDAFLPEVSATTGDLLSAFLAGTRKALDEAGRRTFTMTLQRLDEAHLGALVAFWERCVGLLGSLWRVNAYDQPGVEAGKTAAREVLALQAELLVALEDGDEKDAEGWAEALEADPDLCFHVLRHLAANGRILENGHGKSRLFRRFYLA